MSQIAASSTGSVAALQPSGDAPPVAKPQQYNHSQQLQSLERQLLVAPPPSATSSSPPASAAAAATARLR
eukprot:6182645-Pleurochrysis_carterae.AAC.3